MVFEHWCERGILHDIAIKPKRKLCRRTAHKAEKRCRGYKRSTGMAASPTNYASRYMPASSQHSKMRQSLYPGYCCIDSQRHPSQAQKGLENDVQTTKDIKQRSHEGKKVVRVQIPKGATAKDCPEAEVKEGYVERHTSHDANAGNLPE